ncbi:hypothetical protein [Mesobacillus harenae]|uniref:hypothetical protein n=1 Tax=Mesobacillus harenae TaxID=2213203 RepID=UPI001580F42C|nr:hypothetical protein [Mesobacillus harenae]
MTKRLVTALVSIAAALMLGACSESVQDQKESVNLAVKEAFNSKPEVVNTSSKDIDFHLPAGLKVDNESPNNILLKNGSKTYILFYNQHEGLESEVVYNSTLNQNPEPDMNETYTKDEKFGYMLLDSTEDELYELIVGIGGIKVTTETKAKDFEEDAVVMMELANSVKFKSAE